MNYFPPETQAVFFLRGSSNQELLTQALYQVTQNQQGSDLIAKNSEHIFTSFLLTEEKGLVIDSIVLGSFQPIHLNLVFSNNPLWQKKDGRIGWYQMKEGGVQVAAPFQSGLFLTTDSQKNLFEQLVNSDIPTIENKKNDQLLAHDITLQVRDIPFIDKLIKSLTSTPQSSQQPKSFMPKALFSRFFSMFSGGSKNASVSSLSFSSLPLRSLEFFLDRVEENYVVGLSLEFRTPKEASTSRALLLTMINRFLFQNGYQSTFVNRDIKASVKENVLTFQGLKISQETLLLKLLGEATSL